MYAVISDRGRQYKAVAGARLTIDRSDAEVGTSIDLPVLLIADDAGVKVGAPFVAGAKAVIKVLSHIRGTKGIVGKYKRRKHQRRRHGYRAEQSVVEIVSISA